MPRARYGGVGGRARLLRRHIRAFVHDGQDAFQTRARPSRQGPARRPGLRGEPCTSRARAAAANNGAPPCALRGSDQASRSGDCSLGTGLAGPWGHGRWRLCVPRALRALHLGASQPLPRSSEFRPGPFRSHAPCDASPDGGEHLRSSPSACRPAPQHQHVRLTHTGWLCRDRTQVWCLQTQEAGAGALVAASDPVPQRLWREGRTQAPRPPGRSSGLSPVALRPGSQAQNMLDVSSELETERELLWPLHPAQAPDTAPPSHCHESPPQSHHHQ